MARTVIGISPWAVIKIIGMGTLAMANSRWKSRPLIPGNLMSRTRQLGTSGRLLRRNSCADSNSSTCSPTDPIRRLIARRTEGSSSTTKTIGFASVIKCLSTLRGHSKFEECTIGHCYGPQTPAVGFDNGAADRQTHPNALGLCRREWLEDVVDLPRINSWS